jgi:hypothetical protein
MCGGQGTSNSWRPQPLVPEVVRGKPGHASGSQPGLEQGAISRGGREPYHSFTHVALADSDFMDCRVDVRWPALGWELAARAQGTRPESADHPAIVAVLRFITLAPAPPRPNDPR